MRIALVSFPYDADVEGPDALLDRWTTATGWAEAVAAANRVTSVHRFGRDARIVRNEVEYLFVRDGANGDPRSKVWTRRMNRAVADLQPDIVHVHGMDVPIQTWLLRRALPAGAALVVQDHGGAFPTPARGGSPAGNITSLVRKAAMRAADGFFFTSQTQADPWRRAGLIAPDQSVHQLLESSTTLEPIDRGVAQQTTGVKGNPAVLWVGRLNANKDPLTVLDGFEHSLPQLPDAHLTMIFSERDLLPGVRQRLAESPTLADRVTLTGAVAHDRMAGFYSAADLFVLGSHHEGSGYALIEACACGTTPVVTDIPSFRAITGDGSIGALWPPGSASALAERLVAMSRGDRAARRRQVLDHFDRALSWASLGRQAVETYAGVVAAVRAGTR